MFPSQIALDVPKSEAMEVVARAKLVSTVMKALSHEARLAILCHLATGPKSVSELQELVDMRQTSVSQQLARLRLEKLVDSRRVGKSMYYSLVEGDAARLIKALHKVFCNTSI